MDVDFYVNMDKSKVGVQIPAWKDDSIEVESLGKENFEIDHKTVWESFSGEKTVFVSGFDCGRNDSRRNWPWR